MQSEIHVSHTVRAVDDFNFPHLASEIRFNLRPLSLSLSLSPTQSSVVFLIEMRGSFPWHLPWYTDAKVIQMLSMESGMVAYFITLCVESIISSKWREKRQPR